MFAVQCTAFLLDVQQGWHSTAS